MAIHKSDWAAGRKQAPVSREARGVVVERFTYTVGERIEDGDIIELAVLPAYHFVVDAILITDGLGSGTTADIGIMSGAVGDDGPRTCGDEFYSGTDVSADSVARASIPSAFKIKPANTDRSIGIKASGSIAASGQEIMLILFTAQ